MNITITRENIAAYLAAIGPAKYNPGDSRIVYKLYVTFDQKLVPAGSHDWGFFATRNVMSLLGCECEADLDALDDDFEFDNSLLGENTLDNPEFAAVVDDIYNQVVTFFEDNADKIEKYYL